MSILVNLASRPSDHICCKETSAVHHQDINSYESLRNHIRDLEISMAKTSSSTTVGGIDYDTDDNDHR
jgi:hypothetical protein